MLAELLGLAGFIIIVVTLVRWFYALKQVAIPKNRVFYISSILIAAGLGAVAVMLDAGFWINAASGLTVIVGVVFFILFAMSKQKGGPGQLIVGAPFPHFTVNDENASPFDTSSLVGSPFMFKFFRGHW